MQLPSLDYILNQSQSTLLRFPFVLASAVLASGIAIYLTELPYQEVEDVPFLFNAIMVLVLGIALFTGLTLVAEKKKWNPLLVNGVGGLLLVGYYLLLPDDLYEAPYKHLLRYVLYFIAVHLMVAIGPFWERGKMNGFWQYNKTLFLRFLTAILFSGVLFLGLAIALASVEMLFNAAIDEETYLQLFFFLGGVFNTWFFLAGIPKPLDKLERQTTYPRGLKIFTQYILIPLVIVYLVILYSYTGKIILEWSWPEGLVAYLVLSFSIVGILALLLLHPIRENVENRWIKRFSHSYFRALIPLVILLLLAIWVRIDEYSFTVNRYFVLSLGIWLAGIVGYFIFSKEQNIKVIPVSLTLVALFISFGPWGAFSVAERSQIHRLQGYLQENNILKEGRIHKTSASVDWEDRREISSILRYLDNTHGLAGIQPWFEEDLSAFTANPDSSHQPPIYNRPAHIARELMGIEYTLSPVPHNVSSPVIRNFNTKSRRLIEIQPYDWLAQNIQIHPHQHTDSLQIGDQTFFLSLAEDSLNLRLSLEDESQQGLTLPVKNLADTLFQRSPSESYGLSPEEMAIEASNGQWQVKVYFRGVNFKEMENTPRIESARLDLLLSVNSNDH
ncbi:DUF4153 domain-containing protein [Fodinibius salsisoli]|uniref:DUF4153 domain-containing protein n=1 Tax=Fodinibius salsisoli TaxID=2820877 RepID=A0ABT3PMW2_9BACT|nr:DUF4153 domain-containing protein [Fodinibius salsisoli]MCW9707128.1 DUF4153 domain-containing protein [Fodinibius salsisoli]